MAEGRTVDGRIKKGFRLVRGGRLEPVARGQKDGGRAHGKRQDQEGLSPDQGRVGGEGAAEVAEASASVRRRRWVRGRMVPV